MEPRLQLKGLRAETLRALNQERPDWAALEAGIRPGPWPRDDRRMLRYRVEALDRDPSCAPYLLHVVLDEDGEVLGRIGCHAGPNPAGEVEIGYAVRVAERGRGIAGRAVGLYLEWLRDQGVRRVLASVSPDNVASRRILERHGFVETGSRMDDEDGLELVYGLDLGMARDGRVGAGSEPDSSD